MVWRGYVKVPTPGKFFNYFFIIVELEAGVLWFLILSMNIIP